jgi:hypothetical protein
MTIIRCSQDLHYYNSSQYSNCPYCNSSSKYAIPPYIIKGENKRIHSRNAHTKLRIGDIFDIPSDLIVLPCNTYGNVSDFVGKYLYEFNIPYPPPNMQLGYVYLERCLDQSSISQYISFAVSVDRMVSSYQVINYIGQQIGQFTIQEPSIRVISVPLLGVGAGGLMSDSAAIELKQGFLARAHSESVLVISVLNSSTFEKIIAPFNSYCEKKGRDHTSQCQPTQADDKDPNFSNVEIRSSPFSPTFIVHYQHPNATMSSTTNNNLKNYGDGDQFVGDKVSRDKIGTQNINVSQEVQQVAQEIQAIIIQESDGYDLNSEKGQRKATEDIVKAIKSDPKLSDRFKAALKNGGETAIKKIIDHPIAHVVVDTAKGFIKGE